MNYEEWAPVYARIRRTFGFPAQADRDTAHLLAILLTRGPRALSGAPAWTAVRSILQGRPALVVGAGPGPLPSRLPPETTVVAADGAVRRCLDAGWDPAIITTDLDGDLPEEIDCNRKGALVVVHAHGDNRGAVLRWTPRFTGTLVGSCCGPPEFGLLNVGGFTDGDRAAYLAAAAGAHPIVLAGFDFEKVTETGSSGALKHRKMAMARLALRHLQRIDGVSLQLWGPMGPRPLDDR